MGVLNITTWAAVRLIPAAAQAVGPLPGWVQAWWQPAVSLVVIAVAVLAVIRAVRLNCNGWVQTTGAGVAARGEEGVERRMFWRDIAELRALSLLGSSAWTWPRAELRGTDASTRLGIEDVTEDFGELIEAIIRRAGLTESMRKWWGTLYTRPTGT